MHWETAKKVSAKVLKKQIGTIAQAEMGQNNKISMDTTVIEERRRTKQEFRSILIQTKCLTALLELK